jgi:hypothetical protein
MADTRNLCMIFTTNTFIQHCKKKHNFKEINGGGEGPYWQQQIGEAVA